MGCIEADALDAGLRRFFQQFRKAVFDAEVLAVGIDILSQQNDFLCAAFLQFSYFLYDIFMAAGALLAAGIGNDAVGAELVAAVHDIDIAFAGAGAFDRQIFDDPALFRKHFHDSFLRYRHLIQKVRQTVDVVGAEDQIDLAVAVDHSSDDRFLLGHTAAENDDPVFVGLFPGFQGTDLAQHPFFGSLSDRAGVEDQHIPFFRNLGAGVAHQLHHTGHRFPVTDIGLAAVGADIVFLPLSQSCRMVAQRKHVMADIGCLAGAASGFVLVGKDKVFLVLLIHGKDYNSLKCRKKPAGHAGSL